MKYITPLPDKPRYDMTQYGVNYNPEWPMRVNVDHILGEKENFFRLPAEIRNERNLPLLFETAVELARRKAVVEPSIVVPQGYQGRVQYLLPICLTGMEKPDLAMTLTIMDGYYLGNRDEQGQLYYAYQRSSEDTPTLKGSTVILKPSDVLHIPGLGFDGLVGYSPIAMAKNAIGMAIACEEYGAKFFANGAAPGGALEHPGTIKDPQRVRESWQSTFGGSGNANKIAVLEEGMKYTPIGISPEQAQFLETRKFQINEIARIFRVPPHMVGDLEKSSFSNIEQQSLEFVKYTLDPWVVRWEQSITRSLLTPSEKKEYFVKFNLEGLLRGDYQSRMSGYATARQNGWMSANDIRELENLDRIPTEEGGDLYLVNGNMCKLADAGIFARNQEKEEISSE